MPAVIYLGDFSYTGPSPSVLGGGVAFPYGPSVELLLCIPQHLLLHLGMCQRAESARGSPFDWKAQ